jgi:flagellar basal body P-ring formation protein FlgA
MMIMRMICLAAALVFAAPAFADTPVSLRARIEANGPAITLGDVFDGAGEAASRVVAPAPAPGQIAHLSPQVLAAAASAAGLAWQAPAGLRSVDVVRPGGARATLSPEAASYTAGSSAASGAAVRRGQSVLLTFTVPGLTLATRARALSDAAIGEPVQLLNPQSNHTIDAMVTGPGAASATAP